MMPKMAAAHLMPSEYRFSKKILLKEIARALYSRDRGGVFRLPAQTSLVCCLCSESMDSLLDAGGHGGQPIKQTTTPHQKTQGQSRFSSALGYDGRRGFAFAQASAAGHAHGDESCE
jgi:hypothetical protein